MIKIFQNISCYCLTPKIKCGSACYTEFQNISCYCLTQMMLLHLPWTFISKHLMLLFNRNKVDRSKYWLIFQNISCYCLTILKPKVLHISVISKHLMLLFNVFCISKLEFSNSFQNISCYCLTSFSLFCADRNYYFKTSHVIV